LANLYGYPGPPFNFLGHFSQSQWNAFNAWVNARIGYFGDIETFYQIRAQQMRRTGGLLEDFYATENDQPMKPSFMKEAWQPDPKGHFGYAFRNDIVPAVTMAKIKERFQEQLMRDDDGMFFMNHVRNQIERLEDEAQFASVATAETKQHISDINGFVLDPRFEAVLVQDLTDTYMGEPRFRWHQLNPPTAWERMVQQHGGTSTNSKENTPPAPAGTSTVGNPT